MQVHENLFSIFITPFNNASIKYMTTGSVGSIMYGEPRLTHDIDLVLFLTHDDIKKMNSIFLIDDFYMQPEEVMKIETARSSRGHFNIIHNDTGYKADIYLIGNDPLLIWGFKHRRKLKLGESYIWVASPEYIIIQEMAFWEEGQHQKHLNDISAMLKIQCENISKKEIIEKLTSTLQIEKFKELVDTIE